MAIIRDDGLAAVSVVIHRALPCVSSDCCWAGLLQTAQKCVIPLPYSVYRSIISRNKVYLIHKSFHLFLWMSSVSVKRGLLQH